MSKITVTSNLLAAPEHATELGHLVASCGNLEWRLYNLFKAMTRGDPAAIRIIFFTPPNFRGRIELIKRISKIVVDNKTANRIEKLVSKIEKTAGKRNKYIHSHWSTLSSGDVLLTDWRSTDRAAPARGTQTKDIKQTREQVDKWCESLFELENDIVQGSSPQTPRAPSDQP